ncbi:MAG: NlpC/P60 family protein [Actinomycetota bacterium]|nr:MAG: NlpC/P60 family protein [Actinomycetota bacterium]
MALRSAGLRSLRSVVAGALTLVVIAVAMATAAPAGADPQLSLDQVEQQIQQLQAEAESATEDFNSAADDLAEVEAKVGTLRQQLATLQADLDVAQASVGQLVRTTYASGGLDASLQVLLADNPQDFLDSAAAADQVARSQTTALRRTQTARLRLLQAEAAVAAQEQVASAKRDAMAAAKATADARLASAQDLYDTLSAQERAAIESAAAAKAAADREAAAAEQARVDAEEAARNAAERASRDAAGRETTAKTPPKAPAPSAPAAGRAAIAVRYALQQVGDRYVAAGSGPDSFDCSGLTMAAWRAAGVSLPHYSKAQQGVTRSIPTSQAQPGDLVFFFEGGAHHVSLYIGGGRMVSASNPRSGVEIIGVFSPWYADHFSGFGRVAG